MIGLMFTYQVTFLLPLCLTAVNVLDFCRLMLCKHLAHCPDEERKLGRTAHIMAF